MQRYIDVLKKSSNQPQPVNSGDERIATDSEKPTTYRCSRPPPKRGDCNYDRWERSYFTHLVEMYKIFSRGDWNPPEMYQFFQFIFSVSSGEITEHLENFTKEEQEAYFEYLIKRNNFYY